MLFRSRRRGLAKRLSELLLERLLSMGVAGRMREPVLTHPATQAIAIGEGATIVGAHLNATHPIQQIGITDGVQQTRGCLSVAFSALQPLTQATVYVPASYEPMVRQVLDASGWPRAIGPVHRDAVLAAESTISTAFNSDKIGRAHV